MSTRVSVLIGALVLVSAALLAMNLFGVSLADDSLDPTKVGTVADWVTGLLTAATIMIAVVAVREDRRREYEDLRQKEAEETKGRAEIEQLREKERIDRSRACWAWLTVGFDYTGGRMEKAVLHVKNESGLPIYDWRADLRSGGLALSDAEYGPILPGVQSYDCREKNALKAVRRSKEGLRVSLTFKTRFGEVVTRGADGRVSQTREGTTENG